MFARRFAGGYISAMAGESAGILSTSEELESYERGLYQAFVERNPNTLVAAQYTRLPGKRLRSPIPYQDQRLFAIKRGDRVCCALALHERTDGPLQIHYLGLEVPPELRAQGFRELLNLYVEPVPPPESLALIWQLHRQVARHLREHAIEKIIATCSDRLLPFYRGFGLESVQTTRVQGIGGLYHLLSN
jgi:hypothetical protein